MAARRKSKRPGTSATNKSATKKPKRAVARKIAPAAPLPPLPESAGFVQNADPAVRDMLSGSSSPLNSFLVAAGGLTPDERALIVDQAIVLMEGFYVHLPLKKAMHAVDPVQRLRLLRKHLSECKHDAAFHAQMTQIFTSVRDLHTNYLLPSPFSHVFASLPFRVETCVEGGKVVYLVAGLATGFQHPTFTAGVELQYWNGMPIERAVDIAADRHAGSNPDARWARGLAGLTQRPLAIAPPPDEEWVIIGYKALDGSNQQIRLDWLVIGLPPSAVAAMPPESAAARGLDLETELTQRARRILFAPHTEAARAKIDAAADELAAVSDTESIMPEVFTAKEVTTTKGKFGHIRIWTFDVPDPDEFVQEFVRLASLLPPNGLIVDVRDNGGGLIYAGEQLLQVLTPRTVEPERLQFVNTPQTLRLCELNNPSETVSDLDLTPWLPSMQRAVETGSAFSASFPITSPEACNAIGQCYFGPVVLITSARCYSTTDIFSAGFQDHEIGKILGVDGHTGAGGANVWEHPLLGRLFSAAGVPPTPLADSPIKSLPKGTNMRVAIRRTLRVRAQAGTELEDLGVVPDELHSMTRADILNKNVDLMEHAGKLLASMPVVQMTIKVAAGAGDTPKVQVDTQNIDRVDFYLDTRPQRSEPVSAETNSVTVELTRKGGKVLQVQGFQQDKLVAARRMAL